MLLSICIPTYNRPDKVNQLLNFLYVEYQNIDKIKIEFIVGDNSDNLLTHDNCIKSILYQNKLLKYVKNKNNLGLVGNVLNLASLAKGQYVWFMGDDDLYYMNILSIVQKAIIEDNYAFIFLNHKAYYGSNKDSIVFNSAVDLNGNFIYEDGRKMALDIWKESSTSMMFMSACIYNRVELGKCISINMKKDLAFPLFMSFYCASKGKARIINEICIDNIWGEISWSDSRFDVFFIYVPKVLIRLIRLGYNYVESIKLLFDYFKPQYKQIFRYNLKKTKRAIFNRKS